MLDQRRQSRRADPSVRDHACDECSVGGEAELVGHETDGASRLRGDAHGLGLREIERERLLAQHVGTRGYRLEELDYAGLMSVEYFDLPDYGWPLHDPVGHAVALAAHIRSLP